MKNLKFFALIILSGLLQSTLLGNFRIFGVKPDLLLILVVVGGVYFNWKLALFFGLAAGLFYDMFFSQTFGFYVLLFSLWGYVISKVSRKVSIDDPQSLALFIFLITFLNCVITRVIFLSFGKIISIGILLKIAIISSFYNALIFFPVYNILMNLKCLTLDKTDRERDF